LQRSLQKGRHLFSLLKALGPPQRGQGTVFTGCRR
jgi:hypothetical protein